MTTQYFNGQAQQYQQPQGQPQAPQTNGNGIMIQGRIVWTSGNLFTGQHQKDDRTKQLKYNQDGSPTIQYGFGLAVPKIDPRTGQFTEQWVKLYRALQAEALTLYPSGHIPQGFAMKYKDGDVDVDQSGVPYSKREGYAGHIVLACTTQLPIKFFRFEGGNNILVNDGFKCGDYVNVQLNIKAHPAIGQGKPGLYVNPSAVQLIQPGKEIINTPSGDQLFGTNVPSYSGQVDAYQAAPMPQMGQSPQGVPPMGAPMPGAQPAYQPQQVQPHHGVLPPTFQPPQGVPPMGAPGNGQIPTQPGYAPQGTPAYPNQGGMPGNGEQYLSNNGPGVTNGAYPSNQGMPQPGQQYAPPTGQMPMPPR